VGSAGFGDEFFAAEFAQVVGGVPSGVVGVPGDGVHPGGQVFDGEAAGRGGQREHCAQGGADPGFVHIDSADAGGADLGGQRQLIEGVIGEEADIKTVQRGGEPIDHAGEPADDLPEAIQNAAAAQLFGVVHDGLEAQHMFAFGVGLQRQELEMDLEQGEVPPRFLDHDCQPR
jgi:hypothetical protein